MQRRSAPRGRSKCAAAKSPRLNGNEVFVLDVVFVLLSVLFFVVSVGYVAACDRLMK